jgi:anhydro-N-acetylmuramic acid kinase
VLNIGGIANVTILPPNRAGTVRGFDSGPGNGLMDDWARRHLKREFDIDGKWAGSGRIAPVLLGALLKDGYFRRSPPKSTGREHFNIEWLDRIVRGTRRRIPSADVQATLLELTALTISKAIHRYAARCGELLVCGGGVHNPPLMRRLRELLEGISVRSTADRGLDPDCIEAVTFAWLAKKRLERKPGNLPGVTGARRSVLLGGVYEPATRARA